MIRDVLPEHQNWRDDGCDLSPACLSCPLPACRYEMPPGRARMLIEAQQLQTLLTEGKSMNEAAVIMGVSRRSVYRIRRAHLDPGTEGSRSRVEARRLIAGTESEIWRG